MLHNETRQAILPLLERYDRKATALLAVLQTVQGRQGWIDDETVIDLAELLEMTPEEIDAIATSYDKIYRKPVGRHVILLCDGVSCDLTGRKDILAHLKKSLGIGFGDTTADGRFTLLPTACLGACAAAPAMMVDEDLHDNLTSEKLSTILERYE